MPVETIIKEVKTLTSRQVLVLILLASIYGNCYLILQSKADEKNYKSEVQSITKQFNEYKDEQRKKEEQVMILNLEETKEALKKSYLQEKRIDSLMLKK